MPLYKSMEKKKSKLIIQAWNVAAEKIKNKRLRFSKCTFSHGVIAILNPTKSSNMALFFDATTQFEHWLTLHCHEFCLFGSCAHAFLLKNAETNTSINWNYRKESKRFMHNKVRMMIRVGWLRGILAQITIKFSLIAVTVFIDGQC